jgi:ligand-binding sensor domain-containing protein/two-component sensor histidine kinase
LNKYNEREQKFRRYLPNPDIPYSISGTRPASICEDKEGNLLIGTWGGGLNLYDRELDGFIHFNHESENENGLPSDFIRKLYTTSKGEVWIGSWNGLSCVKNIVREDIHLQNYFHDPKDINSISSNKITSIVQDHSECIWVGTLGGGLNRLNMKSESWSRYRHSKDIPGSLSSDDVSALTTDHYDQLWIGTVADGLNKFNRLNENFENIRTEPGNDRSLRGNNVYSIYEDNSGLLWIGANGLNILDPKQENFKHYRNNARDRSSLSHNRVTAFCEDNNGNIWIGTEGGGLNHFYPHNNSFVSYESETRMPNSLSNNNISSIVEDQNGYIWIGTRGGGINKYNPESEKFIHIQQNHEIPETEGLNYINALCMDPDGILWIATYDRGLIRYDLKRNRFRHYLSDPRDPHTLAGNYLLALYRDSNGAIWQGSWGAGLSCFDPINGSFIRFQHDPDRPGTLSSNIVHSIFESKAGPERILWVGTSNGLSYMNLDDQGQEKFKHIYEKDGLPSNVIYGILEDEKGNLWLSSNLGISKFNPKSKSFKNYDREDGLQSNEFNTSACLKLKNGQILFGGINGFNMFHPDSITQSTYLPPIVITSFKVFDQPVGFSLSYSNDHTIELEHHQNFFSFDFAALDFTTPTNNQYAYMMEGFDEDWIYTGTRRYASYTNLDPGKYMLKVKGTNSDGIWNEDTTSLNIIIVPPFWQTWWFRILVILIILILLYLVHKYRLTKLLEIERLRVRIASDLHDDVGSTLTKIALHSEMIQSSDTEAQAKQASKNIGTMSREIISTMSDVVWSIDARNDTMQDLLDRMRDFAFSVLTIKEIQVEFKTKNLILAKKIPIDFRQNIFLIFKEAINNIAKHSEATMVTVNLENRREVFYLRIADNGRGYIPEESQNGNGLKNMKMRSQRLGGELTINSNHGVEIILELKKI